MKLKTNHIWNSPRRSPHPLQCHGWGQGLQFSPENCENFVVFVGYLCRRTGCSRYCHLFSLYLLVIMVRIPCDCLMLLKFLNSQDKVVPFHVHGNASCVFSRTKMFAGFKSSSGAVGWRSSAWSLAFERGGWKPSKQLTLINSQNSPLRFVNTRTI